MYIMHIMCVLYVMCLYKSRFGFELSYTLYSVRVAFCFLLRALYSYCAGNFLQQLNNDL